MTGNWIATAEVYTERSECGLWVTRGAIRKRNGQMDSEKHGYVYILFNKRNGTLYTGVTTHLARRVYEHKSKLGDGFTQKYSVDKLGYYEAHTSILSAIEREKQIKSGSRAAKLALIEGMNPAWTDLYDTLL